VGLPEEAWLWVLGSKTSVFKRKGIGVHPLIITPVIVALYKGGYRKKSHNSPLVSDYIKEAISQNHTTIRKRIKHAPPTLLP